MPPPPSRPQSSGFEKGVKLLPLAGPIGLFALLSLFLFTGRTPEPEVMPVETSRQPAATGWQEVDLHQTSAEGSLPGWFVEQGAFQLREGVLWQLPEPMIEGIYRSWNRFNYGGIRARVTSESHRRVPPRFSIGLEGRRAYHLRAVPAHQRLELVTPPEITLAETAWEWQRDRKLWLELMCLPTDEGGVRIEARAWPEGDVRPADAALILHEENPAGRLSPTVRGGPFALLPLLTDHISIIKLD